MKEKTLSSGLWLVGCAVGLTLSASVAVADNTAEVVVQAGSPVITVTQLSRGSPVYVVSSARKVSYADINFNSPTADSELTKRIQDAAMNVCRRLDENFPDSGPRGRACAEIAVKQALRKVHQNEMAAQRNASN